MNSITLNADLAAVSRLVVEGAMLVYTFAFLSFAFHLSQLASTKKSVRAGASRLEKVGIALLIFAAAIHGVGMTLRGISASRVPWANMYEFSISSALLILLVYLTSLKIKDVRFIATFVTGFVLVTLFAAVSLFYVEVKTLMPALQSYWLVIHVVVAILATSSFASAAGLHIAYLVKSSNIAKRLMELFPALEQLERLAYRFNVVGFVLWSFTLIAGAIWAERAWHRYWGWDTKEVWTFIIWTIYAGYLHANATRGWSGKRSAWLGIIGFLAIIFNFTIVNLYFKGLHVYSGL